MKEQDNQTAVRCPVCNGNGLVPNGFYNQTSGSWDSTSTAPEKCRSCQGQGYIILRRNDQTWQ